MWRYLLILIVLATAAVGAEDVVLFSDNQTALLTHFQLLITESPHLVDILSPANGTAVDRDSVDGTDPDLLAFQLSVPDYVPDGTYLELRGNLTTPTGILSMSNILLGFNVTTARTTTIYYDPNATTYAGNWTVFANSSSATVNSTRIFTSKGGLVAQFRNETVNPNANYTINESINYEANATSLGPETRDELNSTYTISFASVMLNASATSSSVSMSYVNPYWGISHTILNLHGAGTRNVTVNASGTFWYPSSDNRTTDIYSYMNITSNITSPSVVGINMPVNTTCVVQDQFTNYSVQGANVTFYRNGTYLGYNVTNSTGDALFTFSTPIIGDYVITCNVTTQLEVFYYAGDVPEGNSTHSVGNTPPVFAAAVQDYSNDTNPTNMGSNVTFTANATDNEGDQWRLIICTDVEGLTGVNCTGTEVCASGLVNSETNATCSHNTTGELNQTYDWWGYACDNLSNCSAYENGTSPYEVNHIPSTAPTLAPSPPSINDALTCTINGVDPDTGDTVLASYVWYRQNESIGSYSAIGGQVASTLAYPHFDSNDRILCQVTPTDNHGFSGLANNSTPVVAINGTLSAAASLNTSSVLRTHNASLSVSCTVQDGDGESVTVIIQDNRTGAYAQSSTSAAAVYVNTSSITLGRIANTTVGTTVLIRTQTIGVYDFRAQCQASDTNATVANSAPDPLTVAPDTIPPIISNVVSAPTAFSATVNWTTDKTSDSQVDYGTTLALGSTVQNPSYVLSHSVSASSLLPETLYYYNVTSCNVDGYCATSGPFTFNTTQSDDESESITGGFCTGVFAEKNSATSNDSIGKGDIFEFYCELPARVYENEDFAITVTNKEIQTRKDVETPDPIFGNQVVIYPR